MPDWERSDMYDRWPGCRGCVHYNKMRCVAYPERIPIIIASGEVDHMVVRPRQVGDTVFEELDFEHWRATKERRPLLQKPEPASISPS